MSPEVLMAQKKGDPKISFYNTEWALVILRPYSTAE